MGLLRSIEDLVTIILRTLPRNDGNLCDLLSFQPIAIGVTPIRAREISKLWVGSQHVARFVYTREQHLLCGDLLTAVG